MKETLNASVASQPFVFEADAYGILKSYLNDISARLPESERETLQDIEYRLAEIFREKLPSPLMVVTSSLVAEAMAQMGRPSDFGERLDGTAEGEAADSDTAGQNATYADTAADPSASADTADGTAATAGNEHRRLRRSLSDRSIAGVCGGIGAFFDIDTTLVRLATLLLICFGGLSIWAYVILWIVVPEEPARPFYARNNQKNQ